MTSQLSCHSWRAMTAAWFNDHLPSTPTEVSNVPGRGRPNTAQSLGDDGWRQTDSQRGRPLCIVGLGHCHVIMNVGKLTQAQTALRLTVAYLLHVLPYVGLVRTFTRYCCSVISRWLVTTVTLLVAVRHQFTRPAVGVCCLHSSQQYSPPSSLQPALNSPPPPRIPFTAVDGCSEWNAGRGRTGASLRCRRSRLLDLVTGFWEMKPDTALKNGYWLPGYRFTTLIETHENMPQTSSHHSHAISQICTWHLWMITLNGTADGI